MQKLPFDFSFPCRFCAQESVGLDKSDKPGGSGTSEHAGFLGFDFITGNSAVKDYNAC